MASTPAYPVYRSPDGQSEQVAPTPAREVQLKFGGWTKVSQPRTKTTTADKTTDAAKPKPTKG